jgi:DNA-binding CsgD family transcriptional regulator
VPVFEWLLGADYAVPVTGPLAAFDRVIRGWAGSEWPAALCAARELAVCTSSDQLSLQMAALMATEMCTWRGEDRAAAAWLDLIPAATPYAAVRGFVEFGLAAEADASALARGWDAFADRRSGMAELSAWRLLMRMAVVAVETGAAEWTGRLRTEADRLRTRKPGTFADEGWTTVSGLLDSDEGRVLVGLDMARRRGNRPDLVWSCLAAGLVVADAREPLHEAYALAQEMGAARLRAKARQLMEYRGVVAPVSRPRDDRLSPVEMRIVELIRGGCTNRQIAATTQVSEKTVENHLTKLFLKVGCRTRHGLAAASLDGRLESVGA